MEFDRAEGIKLSAAGRRISVNVFVVVNDQ